MRALFIADVPLENPNSGSEQVLYHQATGLAKRGVEVYAITRQADPSPWVIRDVRGVREGSYSASQGDLIRGFISLRKYPLRFYRSFSEGSPFQVAVSHQPFNFFLLLAARKLAHVPILYVFHSPSHEEYLLSHQKNHLLRNLPHVNTRRFVEKLCLKKALRVMVLSKYMKQKVRDIHGISSDRIVINPGGVDLSRFRPPRDREVLKAQLGFPEGKVHLLTVRNLEPRMGIENLLTCMHTLKREDLDTHLILGGEGAERGALENMIKDLGLRGEVTMTGFIPSDLLPQYYGAADFFVLPTKHLEGFGLVTPESMACGTPVLGTPVGGTREILSGFEPRFLFRDNTAEAMVEGIRETLRAYFPFECNYDDLRTRCREHAVANYSWERHISQLQSIIEEIT
ncbi:MAG: glycosyltransferase family 4 protein [Deltaproteobacteria bacterium]|nr:glycosyltransferase family 4 protein [Deltaproteobacteria bacterium]